MGSPVSEIMALVEVIAEAVQVGWTLYEFYDKLHKARKVTNSRRSLLNLMRFAMISMP